MFDGKAPAPLAMRQGSRFDIDLTRVSAPVQRLLTAAERAAGNALLLALRRDPVTWQLLQSAAVHMWNGLAFPEESPHRRVAVQTFHGDLDAIAEKLASDAHLLGWFGSAAGIRFYLLGLVKTAVCGPDAGREDFPIVLYQFLPRQRMRLGVDEEGVPWMSGHGSPAEENKLRPLYNCLKTAAGAPKNDRGREPEDGGGRAPKEFRQRIEKALQRAYDECHRNAKGVTVKTEARKAITVSALAKYSLYNRTYVSETLPMYVDMERVRWWQPGDVSPFDPA